MALTTTEENQLRELLRHSNTAQGGKLASDLPDWNGLQPGQAIIAANGNQLIRASGHQVATMATLADVTSGNSSAASNTVNHLMTRDATRAEIARITDSRFVGVENAVTANTNGVNRLTNNLNTLRNDVTQRVSNLESWQNNTVTPELSKRVKIIGTAFSHNPVIQAGSLNPNNGPSSRVHRFLLPMGKYPMLFFSMVGDVNYPRFDWIEEGGKIVGFSLYHNPSSGGWMALGVQA